MNKHTNGPFKVESGIIVQAITGIPIVHADRTPGNGTTPVERDENIKRICDLMNRFWVS